MSKLSARNVGSFWFLGVSWALIILPLGLMHVTSHHADPIIPIPVFFAAFIAVVGAVYLVFCLYVVIRWLLTVYSLSKLARQVAVVERELSKQHATEADLPVHERSDDSRKQEKWRRLKFEQECEKTSLRATYVELALGMAIVVFAAWLISLCAASFWVVGGYQCLESPTAVVPTYGPFRLGTEDNLCKEIR